MPSRLYVNVVNNVLIIGMEVKTRNFGISASTSGIIIRCKNQDELAV